MLKALSSCLLIALLSAGHAHAQDGGAFRNTFYLGAGHAKADGPFENDDTPFSVGFMHQPAGGKMVLGFDIGAEGTMLDSTWGQDSHPEQGTSLNFLIGRNLLDNGRFRADAALLVGVREAAADCPDSYLGFQCYADADPDTDYKGNFGGVLAVSVDRLVLGLRATGESTQMVAGFKILILSGGAVWRVTQHAWRPPVLSRAGQRGGA